MLIVQKERREVTLDLRHEHIPSANYGPHWYATSADVPGLHLIYKSLDDVFTHGKTAAETLIRLNEKKDVVVNITQIRITKSPNP